jgi:hypothetical protein
MDVDEPAGPVNDEEGSQSDEPRDTGAIDELEALMNKYVVYSFFICSVCQ